MKIEKRIYWAIALVAVLALTGATVTFTARLTSAGSSTPSADVCDQQDEADDAAEAKDAPDTGAFDEECGSQDEADDSADANEAEDGDEPAGGDGDGEVNDDSEAQAPSGTLDDGKDLLPQAKITVDGAVAAAAAAAVAAAQSAASGSIGEVDLEHYNGKLVFNIDVGERDVKVDASTGAVLSADKND